MIYNTSAWQNLAPNIYDAGGQIMVIKQPFLTSKAARLVGGLLLVGAVVSGIVVYLNAHEILPMMLIMNIVELALGAWLLKSGLNGIRVRAENGGVHPKDTLYILDRDQDEVRKQIDMTTERLAKLSEVTLNIEIDHGDKKTEYELKMQLPNGQKIELFESTNRTVVENLLNEIKTRLAIVERIEVPAIENTSM